MRKNIILILSLFLLMFSCKKDEVPSIIINSQEINISNARSSEIISFTTNMSWTATSSENWCTLSQTSGDNSTKSITIVAATNDTYDDRSATVTIKVEGLTKTIKINQSQGDAIILSNKSQKISGESQTLEIELQTNIEVEVIIPEAAKSWVSYTPTRALRTEKLLLQIEANDESFDERTTKIYIKNVATTLQETFTIIQRGALASTIIVGTSNSIQHIDITKDFIFQLNNLVDKEVFFVFSNTNQNNSIELPMLQSDVQSRSNSVTSAPYSEPSFIVSGKPAITKFNNNPGKQFIKGASKPLYQKHSALHPLKLEVGTSEDFFDDEGNAVKSTVRKVISAHGKNLYMWVADNCWGPDSKKTYHVTQTMIDAFAPKFLNEGADNDIYEWVTNAAGAPWGATSYKYLIPETDDIHIWLTDIDDDNKTTGTITLGYYYARDNFIKNLNDDLLKGSNEKLMFTLDAVLFGQTNKGSWNVTDYWPQEFISTLAHEFTHMIYFYQKEVIKNKNSNTAINEMSAQCIEDLVASKIMANGPRGVPYGTPNSGNSGIKNGRIPLFNSNNDFNLLDWSSNENESLINYSKTYTFGAFLMRNYGGAKLIRELIQNNATGTASIVNAVNANGGAVQNYGEILQRFGVANLLSNQTAVKAGYSFNNGGWSTSTINGITYELGSINLYNYSPIPNIYNILPKTQKPGSNILYRAGSNMNGKQEWQFNGMSSDSRLTVVIK